MRIANSLEVLESRQLLSAYFVSNSGNDSAAGTTSAPWKTLQKAADVVKAGDVVTVRAGTYTGFNMTRSGSSSARITFNADPGVVVNQRNARTADGINLEGASYVTIRGFTVVGVPRAGIRSVTNTGAEILNNITDSNAVWGILTGFSQNVLIEGNTASRSGQQHGIYVGNSADNPVIRGNTVFGNKQSGIQINADLVQGGDGIITNALVEKNRIYNNGTGGGSAINLDGVQSSSILNNLLYDNHASGISIYRADGAAGGINNRITNNTIVMANSSASPGRYALNIQNGSTGNAVANNVLYSYFPSSGGKGSITISSDSLSDFTSDYNVVNDASGFTRGNTTNNFAQWKSASGQDAHSIVAKPSDLFTNATAFDFALKSGCTAVDHGTRTNAPQTDIIGNPRLMGTSVDIGAYELIGTTGGGGGGGGGSTNPKKDPMMQLVVDGANWLWQPGVSNANPLDLVL